MSCTAHHFWRGTCVIGHRWEGEGASSLGPRMYPTAPCLVLPAPWLSSDSPPSSRWGHRAGSTSNLSAGSGENNRGGCDKVQWENKRGGGGRANSGITTSLSWCVVVWQSVGGEQLVWGGKTKHLILSEAHEIEVSLASKHRPLMTCYCPGRNLTTVMNVRTNSRPKNKKQNTSQVYVCVTFVRLDTFLWDFLHLHPPH